MAALHKLEMQEARRVRQLQAAEDRRLRKQRERKQRELELKQATRFAKRHAAGRDGNASSGTCTCRLAQFRNAVSWHPEMMCVLITLIWWSRRF